MLIHWGVVMFAVKLLESNVAGRLTELGTSCSMLLWDSAVAFEHCRDFLPTFHWPEWSQEFVCFCHQKSPKVEKSNRSLCSLWGNKAGGKLQVFVSVASCSRCSWRCCRWCYYLPKVPDVNNLAGPVNCLLAKFRVTHQSSQIIPLNIPLPSWVRLVFWSPRFFWSFLSRGFPVKFSWALGGVRWEEVNKDSIACRQSRCWGVSPELSNKKQVCRVFFSTWTQWDHGFVAGPLGWKCSTLRHGCTWKQEKSPSSSKRIFSLKRNCAAKPIAMKSSTDQITTWFGGSFGSRMRNDAVGRHGWCMNQFAVALTLLTFHVAVLPRAHLSQHVSKCSDDCSLAGLKWSSLDQSSDFA